MANEIHFKGDVKFINYLKMIGYKQIPMNSHKVYFTNGKGSQLRVDLRLINITFLDQKGFEIESKPSFTSQEINEYAKGGIYE